jgi:filamentous hemagglutinin family protein
MTYARRSLWLTSAAFAVLAPAALAADLPTGGQITAGSGSISTSGTTMTVTQDTAAMAADWQSFSIGSGHAVNFVQPSADAVALNRVLGSDVSVIQGALTANGKVFLINPNGVLFTPDAQVNVGGLVASTQNITTADFMAGRYTFEGVSSNAVVNQGNIHAANGGTVALIAAHIINTGTITADEGNVLVGAGKKVTLDMGGPVKLEIEQGAIDTLIEQGGAVRADGGTIYMTAKAAGDLATSVINHTGITEAKTLSTGKNGKIVLMGDMQKGTAKIGGKLDASAPTGGDGGFIETSAAIVEQQAGLKVTASSVYGQGGEWLIDPYNYTIDATAAGNISDTLDDGTSVTITTAANDASQGSLGNGAVIGDIVVDSSISKTDGGDATLTLRAANSIVVNQAISSSNNKLHVVLDADNNSGARDGGGIVILNNDITTNGGDLSFGTGATATVNGVQTLVGGDVYVGGSGAVNLTTAGGNVTVNGEMLIANPSGLNITTSGGDVDFKSILNSGNEYTKLVTTNIDWDGANTLAKNGTAGLGAVGDQYLATVTSRLENAVVVYTGGFVAGAGLSDGAWLGGRRVKGIGTDGVWRWIFGPEAAMDGGSGLAFYNQATGLAMNGGFINWLSGEPNGGTGPTGEDRLQIGSDLGRWNDLDNNNVPLDIVIRETNLDNSPLVINSGAGSVTFRGEVGTRKELKSLSVTSDDINVNGGYIKTELGQTYSNDVKLGSTSTTLETTGATTDLTLAANRAINYTGGSAASLTLKSARSILMEAGSQINSTTAALNTTLWADSDATNGGYIWMKQSAGTGTAIHTHGGSITLSGGANTTTGFATGVAGVHGNGITMDTATLNSGGGNIVLRGRSATSHTSYASTDSGSTSNANGIRLHGSNLIDAGTGTVSLTGEARSTSGSSNAIETNFTGYTRILSSATNTTAIALNGDANAGSSTNGWGVFLWGTNTSGIVLAATGTNGGVSLIGTGRGGINNGGGVHLEPSSYVLAASGPISITGTKGGASTYEDVVVNSTIGYTASLPAGFGIASPVTASSSNITISADTLSANRVFGGGTFTGSAVQSTGTLTLKQRTNGKAIKVQTTNPSDGSLWISPASLFGSSGLFKTGFSKFVFGDSNTGNVILDNYTFNNDTEINSAGSVTLGAVAISDHNLTINVTGSGTITDSGNIAVSGLKLNATDAAVTLDGTNNTIGTVAGDVASISLLNNGALAIGTVGGMNGIVSDGAVDIATKTGNLTVSRNVSTSSTSASAIVLNAGKDAAAGTSTGGNIILSGGPTFTTGAGGRSTLYTGSATGSTGFNALVSAGHSRFNSDETTTNFTTALGSGVYAIYRDARVITVTANNATKVFDGQPYVGNAGVTYGGFLNGDTATNLTGTLSIGGNADGASNLGNYTFLPSGLSNGFGYTISYSNGTLSIVEPTRDPVKDAAVTVPKSAPVVTATPAFIATPSINAGGLDIVQVSSSGETGSQGSVNLAQIGPHNNAPGILQVFVVDGGVNMPYGLQSNGDTE